MAGTNYHHGANITETTDGSLSLQTVSTAVIGLVVTATDADATAYPLDTPVLVSRPQAGIAKAGTQGTLAKALQHIADQVTCPVVVVRVADGQDAGDTDANVVGTTTADGKYTGLKALLTAESKAGVKPRIIVTPGLDSAAVTAAMASVMQQLNAFGYATCAGATSIAEATTYRGTFSARELMLIYPDFLTADSTAAAPKVALTTAIAAGLRAKIDQTDSYAKTISNVPVNGVGGISKDVFFDFTQPGTDADILNEAGVTTLINRNGFRFWGSRTCDDADYVFESYTRTAQVVKDTVGQGVFDYSDKKMTASLIRDIVESINAELRAETNAGNLLGGKCWVDASQNSGDAIKAGKFNISYDFGPIPPLEQLGLTQVFTDTYFADLATTVATANQA
jgi:uncharacterized protein